MVGELQPEDPRSVGPYRLLGRLGSRGMGQVLLGRSAGGRLVAVKVIRTSRDRQHPGRAHAAQKPAAAGLGRGSGRRDHRSVHLGRPGRQLTRRARPGHDRAPATPRGLRTRIRASDQVEFPDRLPHGSHEQLRPEPADRGGVLADAHPDHHHDYLADPYDDPHNDQLADALHHHDQPADGQSDPLTATPTEILEPFDRRDRDGL